MFLGHWWFPNIWTFPKSRSIFVIIYLLQVTFRVTVSTIPNTLHVERIALTDIMSLNIKATV